MKGRIIKGIAGFYYVDTGESGIYECKAKGIFRKDKKKPLVGDHVEIEILSEDEKTGNLTELLERKNELIRPAVANVDQALVIFALEDPKPNVALLDRFLVMMEQQEVPAAVCFNKDDLAGPEKAEEMRKIYEDCGYPVFLCSAAKKEGIDALREYLDGKTTVVAGPSGVGKSSLTNLFQSEIHMETGEISRKLKRGRHTTRHAQLIPLGKDTWLCDTPGFTSLYTENMEKEELRGYFPEFRPLEGSCRFQGCVHVKEPGCAVKNALEQGRIHRSRYENYVMFYEELKEQEKRRY
ncbi:MAG TPA: ribosome small subunit-dependent GTPase A [Candidatus Fusicatenibacter merdavium]|uniref:Small ribosomal subunit biogenesis GTPase RsgA n=1 Tax=Candidatus Fusicatenibacter merdavium TaxID=2838600 RepID=A0A9D1XF97_9FIRM|nr:ribosome small subunit-dependent GTPase A [Candidatus Fusicatenibacter merdavium]